MTGPDTDKFVCENCSAEVEESFDYCPKCGSLFVSANCENHAADEADGVCIICALPFCTKCGTESDERFLCNDHSEYEIRQGMAGVYYEDNTTHLEYVKTLLEEEGLHPMIFLRNEHVWPGVNVKHAHSMHSSKHIIMLPLNEVIRAEEVIEELDV